MDENLAILELKFNRLKCCLCEADRSSSHTLFKFPRDKKNKSILKSHGIHFEDKIVGFVPQSSFASWHHIEKLYEMDSKIYKFSACGKLTKQHIEVLGHKKMNVKLAAQVLSHSVASALNLYVSAGYLESKSVEIAEFTWKIDYLFDSVNSRSLKHEEKEMCAVTNNSFHIEFWKEMINWISKWDIRSRKNNRKIVHACKNGWIITLKAFFEISQNLLQETLIAL